MSSKGRAGEREEAICGNWVWLVRFAGALRIGSSVFEAGYTKETWMVVIGRDVT